MEEEKTLTLKSLEKQTKEQISALKELVELLERKIEIIEMAIRR